MKFLLLILLILSVSACGPTGHRIAGSTEGFVTGTQTVLSDIIVDGLQVRRVRGFDSKCNKNYFDWIELNGPINKDSTVVIARLLSEISKDGLCRTKNTHFSIMVIMNSPGGLISEGFKLGRLFRRYKAKTALVGGQVCASACAVAFLGGWYRVMRPDSVLMFHAPYTKSGLLGMSANCRDAATRQRLKTYYTQMLGQNTASLLMDRTMHYCSATEGWEVNADAAKLYGLTNSNII